MEQPLKARQKMTYNIRKLESGVVDREPFKKLEGTCEEDAEAPGQGDCEGRGVKERVFRKTIAYMANLKLTPASVMVDEVWGPVGTQARDAMEAQLKAEVDAYYVGEAIRKARLAQNLTQEELGERVGVKRAQICKLERGKGSMTLSTLGRVFRALGVTSATLDLGSAGRVALW